MTSAAPIGPAALAAIRPTASSSPIRTKRAQAAYTASRNSTTSPRNDAYSPSLNDIGL